MYWCRANPRERDAEADLQTGGFARESVVWASWGTEEVCWRGIGPSKGLFDTLEGLKYIIV